MSVRFFSRDHRRPSRYPAVRKRYQEAEIAVRSAPVSLLNVINKQLSGTDTAFFPETVQG